MRQAVSAGRIDTYNPNDSVNTSKNPPSCLVNVTFVVISNTPPSPPPTPAPTQTPSPTPTPTPAPTSNNNNNNNNNNGGNGVNVNVPGVNVNLGGEQSILTGITVPDLGSIMQCVLLAVVLFSNSQRNIAGKLGIFFANACISISISDLSSE